jgi:hypothetical protein
MPKACAKHVYELGRVLVKAGQLHTVGVLVGLAPVYVSRVCAHKHPQSIRLVVHKICSFFTPVHDQFIPGFHTTYNKQLRFI